MNNKLFIANLSWSVTEDELQSLFSEAGQVVSVTIPLNRDTGRVRGFAFVEMGTDDEAQKAIKLLHGTPLHNRDLVVSVQDENKARPNGRNAGTSASESNKLFVRNIAESVTEQALTDLLAQAGGVLSCRIPTDQMTYLPKGFAFVEMANVSDAQAAIQQLNGATLGGKALAIAFQDPSRSKPKRNYNGGYRENAGYGRSRANQW